MVFAGPLALRLEEFDGSCLTVGKVGSPLPCSTCALPPFPASSEQYAHVSDIASSMLQTSRSGI